MELPRARGGHWRAASLLVLAAVAYGLAAGIAPPGFYDGFAPQPSYRWVSPPPQFRSGNQPPAPRHAVVAVGSNGVVGGESLITPDSQVQFSFTPGAFEPPAGGGPLVIDIKPVADYPNPSPVRLSTNVYCVTANSRLAPGKPALITLTYSTGINQPGSIYTYPGTPPWHRLAGSQSSIPFTISAYTDALGCFAAGYTPSPSGGGSGLGVGAAIALAVAAIVVLAGLPLLVLRRRG